MKLDTSIGYICGNCSKRIVLDDDELPISGYFHGKTYKNYFAIYRNLICPNCDKPTMVCLILDVKVKNIVKPTNLHYYSVDPTIPASAYIAEVIDFIKKMDCGHTFTLSDLPHYSKISSTDHRRVVIQIHFMVDIGTIEIFGKDSHGVFIYRKVKQ